MSLDSIHHPDESPEQREARLLAKGEAQQEVENDDKAGAATWIRFDAIP